MRPEMMACNLTKPTPGKTAMRPKYRVRGFSRNDRGFPLESRRRCPEPRRKLRPAPTIFTPGIPHWPSRDPMGELGERDLYCLLHNDPILYADFLGLWDWRGYPRGEQGWVPGMNTAKRCRNAAIGAGSGAAVGAGTGLLVGAGVGALGAGVCAAPGAAAGAKEVCGYSSAPFSHVRGNSGLPPISLSIHANMPAKMKRRANDSKKKNTYPNSVTLLYNFRISLLELPCALIMAFSNCILGATISASNPKTIQCVTAPHTNSIHTTEILMQFLM